MSGVGNTSASDRARTGRVVVVNDGALSLEPLTGALAAEGLEAEFAAGPMQGARLVRGRACGAILLSAVRSADGGLAALQKLKADTTPVIVLVAAADRVGLAAAIEHGAASALTLPGDWATLAHHVSFVARSAAVEHALRQAEDEAAAASQVKNGVFQVLCHELKSPLASLVSLSSTLAQSLQQRIDGGEAQQLADIAEAAGRLHAIIGDVQLLSRALCGPEGLALAPSPVAEILEDAIVGLRARSQARGVGIEIATAPGHAVNCDAMLLRQAIHKLADNAVKFSPSGAKVEISARRLGDGATLVAVGDQGPGLSGDRLAQVLHPIVATDMSYARIAGGLGLGLTIARAIAEAHGGTLTIETAPGAGLVAAIRIPAAAPAARRAAS